MLINVTKVHPSEPIPMGNIAAPGFWVDFTSVTVSGCAIFVPASDNVERLCGESFSVETGFESISDYRVLPRGEQRTASMKPLPNPGDYEVTAAVKSVMSLGDGTHRVLVEAEVGDVRFTLTANEIGGREPVVGDTVYFKLAEFSLWDENI